MNPDLHRRPSVPDQPELTWSWPVTAGNEHVSASVLNLGREPLLRIELQWKTGTWEEPVFLSGRLMTRLLSEGTTRHSASEWTGAMDFGVPKRIFQSSKSVARQPCMFWRLTSIMLGLVPGSFAGTGL